MSRLPAPETFLALFEIPEKRARVAVCTERDTLMHVAQWLAKFRQLASSRWDRYEFKTNPQRLHCFIDGHREPTLTIRICSSRAEFDLAQSDMRYEGVEL